MNASTKRCANESVPPAAKQPKTKGVDIYHPTRLPDSKNGLRQLSHTKISEIMGQLGLPNCGTKENNVAVLSKYLKAQRQTRLTLQRLALRTTTTAKPDEEPKEDEEEEPASPLLCADYKFENHGNESPVRVDSVVTEADVINSAHRGWPFYAYPGSAHVPLVPL